MTAAFLVIYEGVPHDPDEWVRYYVEEHLPLVWEFPGIRGIEVHLGTGDSDLFLVTRLLFDDPESLQNAVTSHERAIARRDMDENVLRHFDGTVRHQAMDVLLLTPPG